MDKDYRWGYNSEGQLKCWYIGHEHALKAFLFHCRNNPDTSISELGSFLHEIGGHFSIIIQQNTRIIAAVDKIRSYPVFYYTSGNDLMVSNSARLLRDTLDLKDIDDLSLLEFRMAGYVTGEDTLYTGLSQLQAGEIMIWDENSKLEKQRYFLFYSENVRNDSEESLIEELDEITNPIFYRIIERAGGAPIRVPLSGGLDSRLVLCKLQELGYDNLEAFSYGPPDNYEAKVARYVAEKVGVPWKFFPSRRKDAIRFFFTNLRKEHWRFSDGLCVLPFYQDSQILWENERTKKIPKEAIIINGNSGDFITGGHIPKYQEKVLVPVEDFLKALIDKHFSLWTSLKSNENLEKVKRKILDRLELKRDWNLQPQALAKYWEWWEWQERQCKFVVNGQRNYDFFGYRWELPLWDDDYLDFWRLIPIRLKLGQNLYKKYLINMNFFGVFRNFPFKIWRWPGAMIAVVPMVRIIKLIYGNETAEKLYKVLSYWGHYSDWYAYSSFRFFLKHCFDIRGPNALFVNRWLEEESIPLS